MVAQESDWQWIKYAVHIRVVVVPACIVRDTAPFLDVVVYVSPMSPRALQEGRYECVVFARTIYLVGLAQKTIRDILLVPY